MRPRCGATVSSSDGRAASPGRGGHRADRRPDRSGHPVHRGSAEAREKIEATGLLLRAMPLIYSMEREKYEEAGGYIQKALKPSPTTRWRRPGPRYWHMFYVGQGWPDDVGGTIAISRGSRAARDQARSRQRRGACDLRAYLRVRAQELRRSPCYHFDKALRLNPNLAFIWALSARPTATSASRKPRSSGLSAIASLRRSIPISSCSRTSCDRPRDPRRLRASGRYRAPRGDGQPAFVNGYKPLIAALGHLGKIDEARPYVSTLLEIEPNFTRAALREGLSDEEGVRPRAVHRGTAARRRAGALRQRPAGNSYPSRIKSGTGFPDHAHLRLTQLRRRP